MSHPWKRTLVCVCCVYNAGIELDLVVYIENTRIYIRVYILPFVLNNSI